MERVLKRVLDDKEGEMYDEKAWRFRMRQDTPQRRGHGRYSTRYCSGERRLATRVAYIELPE